MLCMQSAHHFSNTPVNSLPPKMSMMLLVDFLPSLPSDNLCSCHSSLRLWLVAFMSVSELRRLMLVRITPTLIGGAVDVLWDEVDVRTAARVDVDSTPQFICGLPEELWHSIVPPVADCRKRAVSGSTQCWRERRAYRTILRRSPATSTLAQEIRWTIEDRLH